MYECMYQASAESLQIKFSAPPQVLLTFQNAMQYNPANHDVHTMAKALKELFLSKWEPIESKVIELWRTEQVGAPSVSKNFAVIT